MTRTAAVGFPRTVVREPPLICYRYLALSIEKEFPRDLEHEVRTEESLSGVISSGLKQVVKEVVRRRSGAAMSLLRLRRGVLLWKDVWQRVYIVLKSPKHGSKALCRY